MGNSTQTHQIRWYVWSGGEKLAHTATMRGSWPGWDAECSCGWGSHTGGAIKARVQEGVRDHKSDVDLQARGIFDENMQLTDDGRKWLDDQIAANVKLEVAP